MARQKQHKNNDTGRIYDELLLTLICQGDRAAAERLAARRRPRLYRMARRLLQDSSQADIAVQEAWVGIWRGWMTLRDPAKFPAWAFQILHHKCIDIIKHNQKGRGTSGRYF